jgi:hypothetical protein
MPPPDKENMKTLWKVEKYYEIMVKPEEIAKETPSTVVFAYKDCSGKDRTQKEHKVTTYHNYFQTEKEAVEFAIKLVTSKIKNAETQLAINQNKLKELEGRL